MVFSKLKLILSLPTLAFLAACAHQPKLDKPSDNLQTVAIESTKPLFISKNGEIHLGGLSDLVFDSAASNDQEWVFYTMTDRGPNGKSTGPKSASKRPFLFPDFSPQILKISFDPKTQTAHLSEQIPLTRPDGSPASGLPLARSAQGIADEVAVDTTKRQLALDPWGMDPEGLAKDSEGFFWIAEEYSPALLKISPHGKILKRWSARDIPSTLPAFLALRKINRGFEAVTWNKEGNLLLFLQSKMPSQSRLDVAPVIEFDPRTEKTVGLYLYPLSPEGGKIGAATLSASKELFVLEQSGKTGPKAWQKIFKIEATSIDNLFSPSALNDRQWKISLKAPVLKKTESVDLAATGLASYEKLEGMAFDPQGRFVILNDNDFGVNAENNVKSFLFFVPRKNP